MLNPTNSLTSALEQAHRLVVSIPTDRYPEPTPCTEYTVGDLIAHLIMIADRVTVASTGDPGDDRFPDGQTTLVDQWQVAYARTRDAILAADRATVVDLPFGRMPLGAGFTAWIGEFTAHSWDLAAALGRRAELDEELAQTALELVTARIPDTPRDRAPFDHVVAVSPEAPASDRLAGWLGRDPGAW